ncbi:MAG: tetratricopeptide repeat protein, partial [Rhodocyclaceae bacterium]|nr:tetratricopeptide repeat protein [Rhodocyclaceae bacterium]
MRYPSILMLLLAAGLLAACGGGSASRPEAVVERNPAGYQEGLVVDQRERAKVHTDLGIAYLQDGRIEIALEEAEIALDAWSGYAPAHNLKALVHMSLRQNEQAEASFKRAVQLAPDNPVINNDYGWFLCQTGRYKEAFAHFNKALSNPLYPNPSHALHNMG